MPERHVLSHRPLVAELERGPDRAGDLLLGVGRQRGPDRDERSRVDGELADRHVDLDGGPGRQAGDEGVLIEAPDPAVVVAADRGAGGGVEREVDALEAG